MFHRNISLVEMMLFIFDSKISFEQYIFQKINCIISTVPPGRYQKQHFFLATDEMFLWNMKYCYWVLANGRDNMWEFVNSSIINFVKSRIANLFTNKCSIGTSHWLQNNNDWLNVPSEHLVGRYLGFCKLFGNKL